MIDRLCYWYSMRNWVSTAKLPGWVLARAGRHAYSPTISAQQRQEGK